MGNAVSHERKWFLICCTKSQWRMNQAWVGAFSGLLDTSVHVWKCICTLPEFTISSTITSTPIHLSTFGSKICYNVLYEIMIYFYYNINSQLHGRFRWLLQTMNDFSPTVCVYTGWTSGNTKSTVQVTMRQKKKQKKLKVWQRAKHEQDNRHAV